MPNRLVLIGVLLMTCISLPAQEDTRENAEEPSSDQEQVAEQEKAPETGQEKEANARQEEAALNEDPEAQLRSRVQEDPDYMDKWPSIHLYGSVRLHAINNFNEQDEATEFSLGDGASRVGVRYDWEFTRGWYLFGRAEGGFDVLDTFTPNGNNDGEEGVGLTSRLLYGGVTSKNLVAVWGKNWSSYYQIAGMADRFSIFGGQAVGIYNAGTDGGRDRNRAGGQCPAGTNLYQCPARHTDQAVQSQPAVPAR